MRIFIYKFIAISTAFFSLFVFVTAQIKEFDIYRVDDSIDACVDFYQYANGVWLRESKLPATYSRWNSFDIMRENNRRILREILEKAAQINSVKDSNVRLLGNFYYSCMNEAAIEKADAAPVAPYLGEIEKIKSKEDLIKQFAVMHDRKINAVFGFWNKPDFKDSSIVIANARQAGLSLPNRDYYTNTDEKSKEIREKFMAYMVKMFELFGDSRPQAETNAKTVFAVQKRFAEASLPPVEYRKPENRYHIVSLAEAQKLAPNLRWEIYLKSRRVPTISEFNIGQPLFFAEVNKMLTDISLSDWKTYLRWMTIDDAAPYLSEKLADEHFNFYSQYLSGIKQQQSREERCVQMADNMLGESLGQEYVKENFNPAAKKRVDEIIDKLLTAMKERINDLEWMSQTTKQQAQAKLSKFTRKIGYPVTLRGYKNLVVKRNVSYYENLTKATEFITRRDLQDIGKPVDETRWEMTAPSVNAYYSTLSNEIVFPAGILQPPFFDFASDDAVNYGAIGAIIGHEMTHGFDDQGSKFDGAGNLNSWWTENDRQKFEDRAACLVKQFGEYEVQPGLHMNGELTVGENIADLGGLNIAYDAFVNSIKDKPPSPKKDGFTPQQRFFLSWAKAWASLLTEERIRRQIQTDPHALPRWRVNGPLSNMPEFAEAFGCKLSQPMVRKNLCSIW